MISQPRQLAIKTEIFLCKADWEIQMSKLSMLWERGVVGVDLSTDKHEDSTYLHFS